jgi:hypothetical protein
MDQANKTWGIGMLEWWKNGSNGYLFHLLSLNIPFFHHSNTTVSVPPVENMPLMFGPISSSMVF